MLRLDSRAPGGSLLEGAVVPGMTRRQFLFGLALAAALPRDATATGDRRALRYEVDVGILYDALRFHVVGAIGEWIDRETGRYEFRVEGDGDGMVHRAHTRGIRRNGRWVPLEANTRFVVHGREARTEVTYDYAAASIHYRSRSETFLLRRIRSVDDRLPMPDGHVDDMASAALNYADGLWIAGPDGRLETQVVRRRRAPHEGVDDVAPVARAELVPLVLMMEPGTQAAVLDLTRFSSWAREDRPARVVFGADRRLRAITSSMILGTSLSIRIRSQASTS